MLTLDSLPFLNDRYYVGHIIESPTWVDEEQAQLLIMEYNSGVVDGFSIESTLKEIYTKVKDIEPGTFVYFSIETPYSVFIKGATKYEDSIQLLIYPNSSSYLLINVEDWKLAVEDCDEFSYIRELKNKAIL